MTRESQRPVAMSGWCKVTAHELGLLQAALNRHGYFTSKHRLFCDDRYSVSYAVYDLEGFKRAQRLQRGVEAPRTERARRWWQFWKRV